MFVMPLMVAVGEHASNSATLLLRVTSIVLISQGQADVCPMALTVNEAVSTVNGYDDAFAVAGSSIVWEAKMIPSLTSTLTVDADRP